jgi:hypothetical protein
MGFTQIQRIPVAAHHTTTQAADTALQSLPLEPADTHPHTMARIPVRTRLGNPEATPPGSAPKTAADTRENFHFRVVCSPGKPVVTEMPA